MICNSVGAEQLGVLEVSTYLDLHPRDSDVKLYQIDSDTKRHFPIWELRMKSTTWAVTKMGSPISWLLGVD